MQIRKKGSEKNFKKIAEELHNIRVLLKTIADAYKPVEFDIGIKTITCETTLTTQRTLVAFELGNRGWKKLEKSKEFQDFLVKLQECQKIR